MEYTSKDLARKTLCTPGLINMIASSKKIGKKVRTRNTTCNRSTLAYIFNDQEANRIIQERIKINGLERFISVAKRDKESIIVRFARNGRIEENTYVSLKYAEQVSGKNLATWWARIKYGLCEGIKISRNYILERDFIRFRDSNHGETVSGLAKRLGVSKKTVYNNIMSGIIPKPQKKANGKPYYPKVSIDKISFDYHHPQKVNNFEGKISSTNQINKQHQEDIAYLPIIPEVIKEVELRQFSGFSREFCKYLEQAQAFSAKSRIPEALAPIIHSASSFSQTPLYFKLLLEKSSSLQQKQFNTLLEFLDRIKSNIDVTL